jgi:RimJ/RimL family protein N-acetyltransferase
MPVPLTLHGLDPRDLFDDVYLREDFIALHADHGFDRLDTGTYRHGAGFRPIPGSDRRDLETPWGYGGPVATSAPALAEGLAAWREQQLGLGSVAEFVRLHPFTNPVALADDMEMLEFNRPTVLVDLRLSDGERWQTYSDSTRNCLRKAERALSIRRLDPTEWRAFKELYERMLERTAAGRYYNLSDTYFAELLARPWCTAWIVEDGEGPVAASCFLHSDTPLVHYHLAGGNPRSRPANALYLLLETAFRHYSRLGCAWMQLGGGRTTAQDDALYRFKSKFSHHRAHFYIGGMVHDRAAYAELGGGRGKFLCSGRPESEPAVAGLSAPIALRPMHAADFFAFFRMRADVANIRWTGHAEPPSWTRLEDWFRRELTSGQRRMYLVERGGRAIGYVYVQLDGGTVSTAIGIEAAASGRGAGRAALATLVETLRADGLAPPFEAWILRDNLGSIRAHEAAGYRRDLDALPREAAMASGNALQYRWIWTPPKEN